MRYDVQELRQVASKVGQAAQSVGNASRGNIDRVRSSLAGNFRGEAANALDRELADLHEDLERLAGGLSAISAEIKAYARRLELADADAAKNIGDH